MYKNEENRKYIYLHDEDRRATSWPGCGDSSHHTTSPTRSFVSLPSPRSITFLYSLWIFYTWCIVCNKSKHIGFQHGCHKDPSHRKKKTFHLHCGNDFACMRWRLLSQLNLINRHWAIGRDIHKWEFDRCHLAIGRRWPHRRLHPREKLRNRKNEEYRIWYLGIYHTTKVLLMKFVSALAFRKDEEMLSFDIHSYTVSVVLTLDAAVKEHIQENT